MYLIIGLGNQGDKYKNNRHNIGFMAVDAIASYCGAPSFKAKYRGQFVIHNQGGLKIGLLKTGVFMNECGFSVAQAAGFFKVPAEKIIVFHDELDLPPGQIKAKIGGGHAGHNGLKSIDQHLGTKDYWRVRLGIGHPGDKNKVSSYVLNDFSKEDSKWLTPLLENIGRYADLLCEGKVTDFVGKLPQNKT